MYPSSRTSSPSWHTRTVFALAAAAVLGVASSQADEITYVLPGTDVEVTFEGTVNVRPGPIVAVKHGWLGSVNFLPGEVTYVRKKPVEKELETKIRGARALKNAAALVEVGRQALSAGRPDLFREALAALIEVAPDDRTGARMSAFVAEYDTAPQGWDATAFARMAFGPEEPPTSLTRGRSVLYLVGDAESSHAKKLAQRRLLTMERVSETFFFLLALDGVDVQLPTRPLVGVWCAQATDYQRLREKLGPKFAEATGFFAPEPGLSVFFDQSTSSRFGPLLALAEALQKERDEARRKNSPNLSEIVRRAEATQLVAHAAQERSDVETVAHESVHQLVALSGFFPTGAHPPRSLHEGIATYFEACGANGWAGPGTILKERHARLIKLLASPGSCSIMEVVSATPNPDGPTLNLLDSYAYCWGAVHFLAEKHPAAFYTFCGDVARESQTGPLPPERVADLLMSATERDAAALDAEWRDHVKSLVP